MTLGPFPPSVALDCLDTTVHVVARVLGPIFYGAQCACCAHAYPFVPSICESEKLITLKRGLDTVDRVRLPTLLATSLPKCSRAMGCRPAQSPSLRLAQLPYTTPDRVKNRSQYSTRAVPTQLQRFYSLNVESCWCFCAVGFISGSLKPSSHGTLNYHPQASVDNWYYIGHGRPAPEFRRGCEATVFALSDSIGCDRDTCRISDSDFDIVRLEFCRNPGMYDLARVCQNATIPNEVNTQESLL